MAEYIDKQAAINRIKEYALEVYGIDLDDAKQFAGGSLVENYSEGLYEAKELVEDIPTADVATVVHGRWMPFHSEAAGDIQYCSACEIGFDAKTDYCPNCGAKMGGGDLDGQKV